MLCSCFWWKENLAHLTAARLAIVLESVQAAGANSLKSFGHPHLRLGHQQAQGAGGMDIRRQARAAPEQSFYGSTSAVHFLSSPNLDDPLLHVLCTRPKLSLMHQNVIFAALEAG